MDKKFTVSVPDISVYIANWGFWSWVLAYCCVIWFVGFIYSFFHVRNLVKSGKIEEKDNFGKTVEGLLCWGLFPAIVPCTIVYFIGIKIGIISHFILRNTILRMYDFKK